MRNLFDETDRAEIVRRIGLLRSACGAQWGRMSCAEMVCHASDVLRAALGERPVQPWGGRHRLRTTFLRWYALRVPFRWPHGFPTAPELDAEKKGTRPGVFEEDCQRLIDVIEQFAAAEGTSGSRSHPLFGRLSRREWGRWAYLHTDHHLRQFDV